VVGAQAPGYRIAGLVRDLGLEEQVRIHGRVPGPTLDAYLAAADVCINLRHPTSGETSAMVLRVLGAGTPVIVSDEGWFSELPDDAVVKVPSGPDEAAALARAIADLARQPERRRALSEGARRLARSRDPASRAAGYAAFVARHRGPAPAAGTRIAAARALDAAAAELGFDAALAGAAGLAGELG
jgi:glycosyltransferase involved in cell wall biosynthesis